MVKAGTVVVISWIAAHIGQKHAIVAAVWWMPLLLSQACESISSI